MRLFEFACLSAAAVAGAGIIGNRAHGADAYPNLRVCVLKVNRDFETPARQISSDLRQDRGKLGLLSGKEWSPGMRLPVAFVGGSNELRARVREAASEWMTYANVELVYLEDKDRNNATVRIAFRQGEGSWSWCGTEAKLVPKTDPTMNFGWLDEHTSNVELRRVVLHEFGHAYGAAHEHQVPAGRSIPWNRDAVYKWYKRTQGWDPPMVNQQIFELFSRSMMYKDDQEIDPMSIMMYPIAPELTTNGFSVGWNNELSSIDKMVISQVYPR